ncbi:MAG: GNAT family N-acetyltransferase [Cytophagales bacterium]|nr:GNAT family N-acetyltransferase [Cytophagales bacterium]
MKICVARTKKEFEEVQSLRYQVNMEELGKEYLFRNSQCDESKYHVLYASRNKHVIGSLRCQFTPYSKELHTYWGIREPEFNTKVSVVDRLVVHPAYRHTRVAFDLTVGIYKQALREGSHIALIEAEEHLLKMYEKIGFRVYRETHYSYGQRFQMYINPWDIDYLRKVRSPFYQEFHNYLKLISSYVHINDTSLSEAKSHQNTPNGVLSAGWH